MTLARVLASLYFVFVVLYTTWGTMEGRGLPGLMTGWMLDRFDWSSDELASSLTAMALLSPLSLLRRQLGLHAASSRLEMTLLYLAIVLTPAIAGWFGHSFLIARDRTETELRLEKLSLKTDPSPKLGDGAHLVRLDGGYLLSETQDYVKDDYGETPYRYVPFVANSEAEAATFVVATQGDNARYAQVVMPGTAPGYAADDFQPTVLDGVARAGKVPVYVEKIWKEDGLALSSPYYLVEPRYLVKDRLPSRLAYLRPELALWLGFGMSAMFAFGIGVGQLARRR